MSVIFSSRLQHLHLPGEATTLSELIIARVQRSLGAVLHQHVYLLPFWSHMFRVSLQLDKTQRRHKPIDGQESGQVAPRSFAMQPNNPESMPFAPIHCKLDYIALPMRFMPLYAAFLHRLPAKSAVL
jgi:hypothetical protein